MTPIANELGAAVPAEDLSLAYNARLDSVLSAPDLAAWGLEIYRVDFFSFTKTATNPPLGLGFSDVATPCLEVLYYPVDGDGYGYGVCTDADQRLFWDGLHPTTAAHRIIGNIAVNALGLNN